MNEIEKIKGSISFMNEWKQVWISELAKSYMDTAIQALQEKLERENGCEYCNEEIDEVKIFYSRRSWTIEKVKPNYCPMCGRKLEHICEAHQHGRGGDRNG